jgi:hypothetical protein
VLPGIADRPGLVSQTSLGECRTVVRRLLLIIRRRRLVVVGVEVRKRGFGQKGGSLESMSGR